MKKTIFTITSLLLISPTSNAGFQPFIQCFRDTGAAGWVLGKNASTSFTPYLTAAQSIDDAGSGWLRLTTTASNQATYAYYNSPINVSKLGIQLLFNYKSWNPGNGGADGIGMFLFDGATSSFSPGPQGGAFAYCAQGYNYTTATGSTKTSYGKATGLSNAVVGVGIDDYGNFSNAYDRCFNGGENGRKYPTIGIRGPGNGYYGYAWWGDTYNVTKTTLSPSTFSTSTTRPSDSSFYRQVKLNIAPNTNPPKSSDNVYNVSLAWATTSAAVPTYSTILGPVTFDPSNPPTPPSIHVQDTQYKTFVPNTATWGNGSNATTESKATYPLPTTVKLGFSGVTGGAYNTHEVRDVYVMEGLPDIAITKDTASLAGGIATFIVTVTNVGSDAITNALFSATPSNVKNISWSCVSSIRADDSSGCSSSGGTGAPTQVAVDLDVVGTVTFVIHGIPTASSISNEALIDTSSATDVATKATFIDADSTNNDTRLSTNDYASSYSKTVATDANASLDISQKPQTADALGLNTVNGQQTLTDAKVFMASYHPQNWWGELFAYTLAESDGSLVAASKPEWDAACSITGGTCPTSTNLTEPSTAQSRVFYTWDGSAGTILSSSHFGSISAISGTTPAATDVYNYVTGTRTKEQSNSGIFRTRTSVLGDIVNSTPVWVGTPSQSYSDTFTDSLHPSETASESAYSTFKSAQANRAGIVYVGSNDGFLHAFKDTNGYELFAYMPSTMTGLSSGGNAIAANSSSDSSINYNYLDPTYTHHYAVDATPVTGDVYFKSAWHTLVAGGQGAGGKAVYVLDVTDPSSISASSVLNEFSPSHIPCASGSSDCGNYLGYTFGTPVIRRMHDGNWAVIFGNGYNSTNNTAAIFIAEINASTGSWKVYTLPVNTASPNGIAYVTPVDYDSDKIVDYLYAGDLYGNIWRFDVTSKTPSDWAVHDYSGTNSSSPSPLFTATNSSGINQPITTQLRVFTIENSNGSKRAVVMFGTGKNIETADMYPDNYSGNNQSIYGIWDWDMDDWNSLGSSSLDSLSSQPSISRSNLQQQQLYYLDTDKTYRSVTSNSICWADNSGCSSNKQYGYYVDLETSEYVIYNPVAYSGTFVVNTTIPTSTVAGLTCYPADAPGGWTLAFNPTNGGATSQSFFANSDGEFTYISGSPVTGVKTNAVGSPTLATISGTTYALSKTSETANSSSPLSGTAVNTFMAGTRATWIQLR